MNKFFLTFGLIIILQACSSEDHSVQDTEAIPVGITAKLHITANNVNSRDDLFLATPHLIVTDQNNNIYTWDSSQKGYLNLTVKVVSSKQLERKVVARVNFNQFIV